MFFVLDASQEKNRADQLFWIQKRQDLHIIYMTLHTHTHTDNKNETR